MLNVRENHSVNVMGVARHTGATSNLKKKVTGLKTNSNFTSKIYIRVYSPYLHKYLSNM